MTEIYLPNRNHSIKLGAKPWPKGVPKVMFRAILKAALPDIPNTYDAEVDGCGQQFPGYMWGNDSKGDCEIVSAANWQRVAEYHEQGKIINITTDDVVNWYFTLTGGPDNGLDDNTVLNAWKATGFRVSEPLPSSAKIAKMKVLKQHPALVKILTKCPCHWNPTPTPVSTGEVLKIYDSAALQGLSEIRCAIALLFGARLAIAITQDAVDQFDSGKPWDYNPNGNNTILGYHSIYAKKYYAADIGGFQVRTWGTVQNITEAYLDRWLDGAYCMVDASDPFPVSSPIDQQKLEAVEKAIVGN
jgi:hypothetical protein